MTPVAQRPTEHVRIDKCRPGAGHLGQEGGVVRGELVADGAQLGFRHQQQVRRVHQQLSASGLGKQFFWCMKNISFLPSYLEHFPTVHCGWVPLVIKEVVEEDIVENGMLFSSEACASDGAPAAVETLAADM